MKHLKLICSLLGGLLFSGTASATLTDLGNGLIYDSNSDITWMEYANFGTHLTDERVDEIMAEVQVVPWTDGTLFHTLTTDDFIKDASGNYTGEMTWWGAMAWAEALVYAGFDDWRLPSTPYPDPDPDSDVTCRPDPTRPLINPEGSCRGAEMGILFYTEGITVDTPDPFLNLQTHYWSSREFFQPPLLVPWNNSNFFVFGDIEDQAGFLQPGIQSYWCKGILIGGSFCDLPGPWAWAVRDGGEPFPDSDIDIKFCSDPNGFNCKSRGETPVTIFGTADFDVTDVDISSLMLCEDGNLANCTGAPLDFSVADRGDPTSDIGAAMCAINLETGEEEDFLNPDGLDDLDVAFDTREVVGVVDCTELNKGDTSLTLVLVGQTTGGTPITSVPVGDPGIDQLVIKNK